MTEKPVEANELDTNWSNEYCHQEYIKFLLHMESSLEYNDQMLNKHPGIDEGKALVFSAHLIFRTHNEVENLSLLKKKE